MVENKVIDIQLKKKCNANRLRKIIFLKLKNNRLAYDIQNYLKMNSNSAYKDYLRTLYRHIVGCSSFVLMKDLGENEYEYVTAHTCKDKLCFICNAERRRITRNRYNAWFDRNAFLYSAGDKIYTAATRPAGCEDRVAYDMMHLTLTVPHTANGYKGNRIYYKQIIADFNRLRKEPIWQYWVYGGEYGVEATPGSTDRRKVKRNGSWTDESDAEYLQRMVDSGMHIHIHALLMVRKAFQNRNRLHRDLLLAWNRLTRDQGNRRVAFEAWQVAAIRRGNQILTDADIQQLSPCGATFIHLKNIYLKDKETGAISYANSDSREARIHAVMETVSYHFKPKTFERSDGSFDVEAIAKVYAVTKGMILYRKFGCLHKDRTLNLKDTTLLDELADAKTAEEAATGANVDTAAAGYFLTPPLNMYVCNDKIKIKKAVRTMDIDATTTKGALAGMQRFIHDNKLFN